MSVVRVRGLWLNPDKVIGIWYEEMIAYQQELAYWRVTLRCEEGQVWFFKHTTEEDAVADYDKIAAEVNAERPSVLAEDVEINRRIDQPPGTFL